MIKLNYLFLIITVFIIGSCGTIYVPQILPEARGVGKSIGQEDIQVKVIPLTLESLRSANTHPYIRRVIDASNLNEPAKLISVEDAIAQKLPPPVMKEPYRLGLGDELLINQAEIRTVNNFSDTGEEQKFTKNDITSRVLKIADDGFVSIVGIGRLQLEGLTQFEAEDLIYRALVQNEKNSDFELQISKFESKKVYLTGYFNEIQGYQSNEESVSRSEIIGGTNFIIVPFTNADLYLHQLIVFLQPKFSKGEDFLLILKRGNDSYRMSLNDVLSGQIKNIRILAEDRVFLEALPYRPETAILTGEVISERLISISAGQRQSLAEALFSQGGAIKVGESDTSQIFVIREMEKESVVAYHLDASDPARLIVAAKFELRPNDIVYVAPQFITNYNRALTKIFSAYAMTFDNNLL